MSHRAHRPPVGSPRRRRLLAGLLSLSVPATGALALAAGTSAQAAAAPTATATFSGSGTSVATVDGTLFAKQGAAVTLKVETSEATKCISGLPSSFLGSRTSSTAKTLWTFTTTAPAGDGVQAVTIGASGDFNRNGNCTGAGITTQAGYVVDNTGPVVSAGLSPAANAAGWNNSDVTVRWTATDAGSGVAGAQPFRTDSVTANGITTLSAPAPPDRLGNLGSTGSATVRVDKAKPSISAVQTKNVDGTTTVTFTCDDSESGGHASSGIATCVADGSTTNSKTVQPGATVTGTATDRAGNTATTSSTAPAGDSTAPTLSGAPTTQPNGDGWYKGDVTVRWTAADPESGIPTPPADTKIEGEGRGLTSSQTVTNGAGLSTTATSSPAVNIDRTAPTTGISGTSNEWVNGAVSLTLSPEDKLSGVASTTYSVDGGAARTGTSVELTANGEHTITYYSTDKAGNAEAANTARVRIDATAPTIGHAFDPSTYRDGAWTKGDVTVTFTCADQGGSGVAGCSSPTTVSAETTTDGQVVTGTATDGAGNSATDSAVVRVDKTAPQIDAVLTGTKNAAGWYKDDVTVSFAATDALSGVAGVTPSELVSEGSGRSVTGTATDAAGNDASVSTPAINVDKTAPVLTGTFAAGWHTGDVTVNWTCTDTLSGPAAQPADTIVQGEGANLSATASCGDEAGNTTTETVTGIQIDRSAPTTQAEATGTPTNGWYGSDVDVKLIGSDNVSGVKATYYTVNGGARQDYSGPISLSEGEHTVVFWSEDQAGNVENAGAPITVKVDKTAPETTVINPISPDSGWFVTSGIPVAFTATDGGSGVAATYYQVDGGAQQTYGKPFTAELSEGTHTITYWSVDLAGNDEAKASTKTVTVRVDTQAPTVTPDDVNDTTWRNSALSKTFAASDAISGLAVATDESFALEASAESTKDASGTVVPTTVTKTVADKAGNSTTRKVSALIDLTAPTGVAFTGGPAEGTRYYGNSVPAAPTCTATDALSGLAKCEVTGYSTAEGTQTLTATATDKAGNTATATRSYTVKNLTRKGFTSPVDMNGVYNTIKGGNTVPLKFEVFDGTQELRSTSVVQGFTAAKMSCTTGSEDAVEVFTTTGATELRYDTTGDQFIQNWKTPTGSGCYKVTMTTVDGQSLSALFKTNR